MKRGSALRFTIDSDCTVVAPYDPVYNGESEPGAFTRRLGGEERLENSFHRGAIHSVAGVGNRDADIRAGLEIRTGRGHVGIDVDILQFHAETSRTVFHGVPRVGAEI